MSIRPSIDSLFNLICPSPSHNYLSIYSINSPISNIFSILAAFILIYANKQLNISELGLLYSSSNTENRIYICIF